MSSRWLLLKGLLVESISQGPNCIAVAAHSTTRRLDHLAHHLGLALGSRPGAGLATKLLLPVSRDTLLRTLRRRARRPKAAASVIGIDDWAWKRGQQYGTLICDLQRHRIVDLLPDREPATLDALLVAHPEIGSSPVTVAAATARR
jgi:transposase